MISPKLNNNNHYYNDNNDNNNANNNNYSNDLKVEKSLFNTHKKNLCTVLHLKRIKFVP